MQVVERFRLRGIGRRADEKVRESMSQAETIQEFWMESRKLADPQKLLDWHSRQEYVEALLADLNTVLEGRSPDPEFIQDVDDELRADIAEFGEAGVTPILLIGKFWQEPDLLAQLTSGDTPSAIFAKFGALVALPDLKIHQWNEFMAAHMGAAESLVATTTANIEMGHNSSVSDSQKVNRGVHGCQEQTFVCQHIAESLHTNIPVGFHWSSEQTDARPDAWCSVCEKLA